MLALSRKLTNRINWVLDNCLPPVLRDSTILMKPVFRALFGEKSQYYLRFKEEAPSLSTERYSWYYTVLASSFIPRKTDLGDGCVSRIRQTVVGESVLDVACGKGYLTSLLAEDAPQRLIVGSDFCPIDSTAGGRHAFVQSDIECLPFPDAAFDTVVSAHTLEHVLDFAKAVKELRRVCRRRLIVVVPRQREYRYTFDLHLRFFPYAFALRRLMGRATARVELIDNDFFYCEERCEAPTHGNADPKEA